MTCAVSVVMPVHNAGPYVDEAVESILAQTVHDFELVVLDNGSTDGSTERLRRWAERDGRIRFEHTPERLGVVGAGNAVVALARAPVIARMDADDVSLPHRLERQLDALDRHPDVVLVASLFEGIDRAGRRVYPPNRGLLLRRSLRQPFTHGTMTFRRAAFDAVGGYAGGGPRFEDTVLALRLREVGRVVVIPETLYRYRFSAESSTARVPTEEAVRAAAARERFLRQYAGDGSLPDPDELYAHAVHERASLALWAGERPRVLRGLLARTGPPRTPGVAAIVAWAAWAQLSPGTLRAALRARARARNAVARVRLRGVEAVEWRPS